jgi:hypothetical protein
MGESVVQERYVKYVDVTGIIGGGLPLMVMGFRRENAGFRRGTGEENLMGFLGVVCQQCKSGTFG